jgi:hypothetical protein
MLSINTRKSAEHVSVHCPTAGLGIKERDRWLSVGRLIRQRSIGSASR